MENTVEYSKDYEYFKENQIFVVLSKGGQHATFNSRLEPRMFFEVTSTGIVDYITIEEYCKMAHRDLMLENKPVPQYATLKGNFVPCHVCKKPLKVRGPVSSKSIAFCDVCEENARFEDPEDL